MGTKSELHVVFLGSKTADRHERMACNVAYKAFHGVRAFKRWLGARRLTRYCRSPRGAARYSVATAWIQEGSDA